MIVYKNQNDEEPFTEWLFSLRDTIIRHRIEIRIDRIRQGNYGDHKRFHGIIELRLDFGKGYRLYCAEEGHALKDIKKALEYWRDYHEQKEI